MEECTCLKDSLETIKKSIEENKTKPKGYKILQIDWEYKSWYPVVRPYFNVIIKSTYAKKDGSESRSKYEHVSIFPTYCPFCGKKYLEIK